MRPGTAGQDLKLQEGLAQADGNRVEGLAMDGPWHMHWPKLIIW